jgi:AraC-like DNA-binding protein
MGKLASSKFGEGEIRGHFYPMESALQLADFALVAGMTLIVILVAIMLRRSKQLSQRLLSIFFALAFFFLLYYYAFIHKSATLAGIAVIFGYGMGFLLGPVLLHYIKSLVFPAHIVKMQLARACIPYFVYWLVFSLPLALNIFNRNILPEYGQWISSTSDIFNIIENVYLIGFCLLSLRLLSRIGLVVRNRYASLENKDLDWIKHLLYGLVGIVALDIALSFYELIFPPVEVIWNIGLFIAFGLIFLVGYLAYRGSFQSRIFIPEMAEARTEQEQEFSENVKPISEKYQLLSESEASELQENLSEILQNEKPYLDENLALSELSERLGITDKKLSELLNKHMQTNFYELINFYRVESVKEKMVNPYYENLTLLAMAYDSGFKSKSGFNRAFKAQTGMTPSQYKKSVSVERISA